MTNFEKYKEELMKINGDFAIDKTTNKLVNCKDLECENCIFYDSCMEEDKIKWLCKEHSILTDNEIDLINILSKINGKEFKFAVRSVNDSTIMLCTNKPRIHSSSFGGCSYITNNSFIRIGGSDVYLFPNIKNEYGIYDIKNKTFIKEEGEK